MKKIVFTVTNDLTFDQRMQRICNSLAQNGYAVTLVGRKGERSLPLTPEKYGQKRLNLLFQKGKLFYFEYHLRLFIFLLFHSFDIACSIDADTLLPVWLATSLKGKKRVFDAHELYPEVPELSGRNFEKNLWLKVENYAIPRFHACYTVSEGIANEYQKRTGKSFSVVRNVPFLQENNLPDLEEKDKTILYQGALNIGRGLEMLIETAKELPVKVLLAGEGDLSKVLREMVEDAGLQKKVIFLGKVPPAELKKITSKAWLGYNLLEPKGLSYELSLANKFFDYIHAHIPSLSPNFVEYREINKKHEVALLCDLSKEEIKKNIHLLFNNKDYYNRLAENCRKAMKEFNWQIEEKRLLNVYRKL